jgi:hypothetical protein
MVEVLIEEMYGSDRNRPRDYRRAVVVEAVVRGKRKKTQFEEKGEVRSKRI